MSLTHGMDPRVVRDIVQRLDAAAGELDQVGDRAHSIVHALQWEGADASRLTERWDTQGRVHIAHVADEVREAGKRLLGEVEAQDAASGSTGAGGGSGGLPGVADLGALVGELFGGDGDGGADDDDGGFWGGLGDLAGDAWDGITGAADDAWDGLTTVGDALGDGVSWLGSTFGDGVGWVGDRIADGMDWAADGVEWLTDQAGGAVSGVSSWAGDLLSNLGAPGRWLGDGITGFGGWLGDGVESFGDAVPRYTDSVQSFVGQFGQILTEGRMPSVSSLVASAVLVMGSGAGLGANFLAGQDLHVFDDGRPVVGPPSTVTDPTRPEDLTDLVTMVDQAQGARPDGSGNIRITTVQGPDGPAVVVSVPGTTDWGPGTSGQSPVDLTGNLVAVSGEQSTAIQGVEQAIAQAQADGTIPPGAPVMLVGHSQGGIIAAQLAADQDFVSRYNVTDMMTFGTPLDGVPVDPRVQTLALQHATDPVPRLDLGGLTIDGVHPGYIDPSRMPGPAGSVTQVTLPNDPNVGNSPFAQHGGETYAWSLDHLTGSDADVIGAYENGLDGFLGGTEVSAVDVPIGREVEED